MKRLVDRLASSRFVRQADALPGPVWALGAYGFDRTVRVLGSFFPGLSGPDATWQGAAIAFAGLLAALLPLGLFVALAQRRPWALPLASAYAGLKALASLAACGWRLFDFRVWYHFGPGSLSAAVLANLLWAAAALALLCYFERSERLARLFPRDERRPVPWWVVALLAVVLFTTGG